MKAYVDTGCTELDLMVSAAVGVMSPIGQDVCICAMGKDVPPQYTKVIYICEGDLTETSDLQAQASADSQKICRYLTLPISLPRLRESIISLSDGDGAKKDPFTYDSRTMTVSTATSSVKLSAKEAKLFELLLADRGTPLSREELRRRLWQNTDGTNAPDVYISYLRRKLTPLLGEGFIVNVRGAGYMIRES